VLLGKKREAATGSIYLSTGGSILVIAVVKLAVGVEPVE
jgi:hypothetical protein